MKVHTLFLLLLITTTLSAQTLYFPPLNGDSWETTAPEELGWCTENILPLYDFLESTNTKAFIVLQDGKIVLEQYFDSFTQDSIWYWASAGKSLTAFMVGLAQEEGYLSINDLTSDYLGEGWTSAPAEKENLITIRNQLTMTTGLDDGVEDVDCTDPSCLQYLADAGDRWAYHNAPYSLLTEVVSNATGLNHNLYINSRLLSKTGMSGAYIPNGYNRVFFSQPRSMARYGLLMLNGGVWDETVVMSDTTYLHAMINTSQDLNLSYGYLWWLNGKESFMLPSSQQVFNFSAMPEAPEDTYAGLGKNGQILNVVPSMNLVLVRMGDSPGTSVPVSNVYNSEIWGYLNEVICTPTLAQEMVNEAEQPLVFPNPATGNINIQPPHFGQPFEVLLFDSYGRLVKTEINSTTLSVADLPKGIYIYQLWQEGAKKEGKLIIGR